MDISVVVPLLNEADSLPELEAWIRRVMEEHQFSYEIVFVDDGSSDNSWAIIQGLAQTNPNVKALRFRRNYGKSPALNEGFKIVQGDVVITMDADLQDSPDEIPELYKMIKEDGYDLVSGWKKKRYDNVATKNLPSKLYNATARRVTGIKLHDMNCGLKAYRNEVVKNIEVYGEMHRFIPYLAKQAGFDKIGEKEVHHQKRKYGKSKFGMDRFIHGFLDLLSIWFLQKFGKKPMHLFGGIGTLTFLIGAVIAIWLIVDKLVSQAHGAYFRPVADQPLFYLALVAIILGAQLFLTGFLGELIARNASDRNKYNIKRRIR